MLDRFMTVLMFTCCILSAVVGGMMAGECDLWPAVTAMFFSVAFFFFGLYFAVESEK